MKPQHRILNESRSGFQTRFRISRCDESSHSISFHSCRLVLFVVPCPSQSSVSIRVIRGLPSFPVVFAVFRGLKTVRAPRVTATHGALSRRIVRASPLRERPAAKRSALALNSPSAWPSSWPTWTSSSRDPPSSWRLSSSWPQIVLPFGVPVSVTC